MVAVEWKQVLLGQVVTLQRGFDLPYRDRRAGSVPIVSSSGISGVHNVARVSGPGVVTGRYGTIGEVFFIEEDFWPLNTTLFVSDFRGNDPLFIAFALQIVDFHSHSGKSGVPGVNRNDLHKIAVKLPPLVEQRAIASALSDVDALISSLDKLIAKKRDIKQAAMQQLLTGRRRLPGFKCTMERVRLGNIAQIVGGGTPRTGVAEYWDGEIRWCTPSDITACRGKYLAETTSNITYQGLKSSAAQLLPPGTLLLCSRATVGEVRIAATEICTNQGFKSLVCGDRVNNEYLYYAIPMMKPRMVEKASGSTFLELSKKDAESLELYLPPFDEQVAIASVFSDMDAEIEALERRRYKTRLLKQGMMQELLTGRVRLV